MLAVTDEEETMPEDLVPDDDECIHGLGMKSACTVCNGRDARERVNGVEGGLWEAKFRGFCRSCEEWFEVGDMIGRVTSGQILCDSCWLDVADRTPGFYL